MTPAATMKCDCCPRQDESVLPDRDGLLCRRCSREATRALLHGTNGSHPHRLNPIRLLSVRRSVSLFPSPAHRPYGGVAAAAQPYGGNGEDRSLAQAQVLGITGRPGESVGCPLPDHDDEALIGRRDRGQWEIVCPSLARPLGLTEVRAVLAYRDVRQVHEQRSKDGTLARAWERVHVPSTTELLRWHELLKHEAGQREPRTIPMPFAPSLSPTAAWFAKRLRLFLGLLPEAWWHQDGPVKPGRRQRKAGEFAFARPFACAYCSRSWDMAAAAMAELRRARIISTVEAGGIGKPTVYRLAGER